MTFTQRIKHKMFLIKRKLLGRYWAVPENKIGVCYSCSFQDRNQKVPLRCLIEEVGLYMCRLHWEDIRKDNDPGMQPFLRSV